MKNITNRNGAKWIELRKNLVLIKDKNRQIFFFPKAPGLKKFYGLKNCRFRIGKGNNYERLNLKNLRVFIKLPFLYWDKYNNGWRFGLPKLYLWKTSSR